jgi:hypothetical protein
MRKYYSNSVTKMFFVLCVMVSLILSGIIVKADDASAVTPDTRLTGYVYSYYDSETTQRTYTKSGGGAYTYKQLFMLQDGTEVPSTITPDTNDKYIIINDTRYNELTSSAQTSFLKDLDKAAKAAPSDSTVGTGTSKVTNETVTNWYNILQQQDGVGTKFMNVILQNTKPDFVTANKIYEPMSGLVGTVLGLGAVLIMAFLGIVMVADIAYITLPPVRLFVSDAKEGGKGEGAKVASSKIFSHDALYAVEEAENNKDGSNRQALGIYFKRRIIMLIVLGVCLMYLVQGQIYSFVGSILDLLSGLI